jgi:hypothetical protein
MFRDGVQRPFSIGQCVLTLSLVAFWIAERLATTLARDLTVGQMCVGGGPVQSVGPNVTSILSLQAAKPDFVAQTATDASP